MSRSVVWRKNGHARYGQFAVEKDIFNLRFDFTTVFWFSVSSKNMKRRDEWCERFPDCAFPENVSIWRQRRFSGERNEPQFPIVTAEIPRERCFGGGEEGGLLFVGKRGVTPADQARGFSLRIGNEEKRGVLMSGKHGIVGTFPGEQ